MVHSSGALEASWAWDCAEPSAPCATRGSPHKHLACELHAVHTCGKVRLHIHLRIPRPSRCQVAPRQGSEVERRHGVQPGGTYYLSRRDARP